MKGAALYELVLGNRTDERLRSAAINLADVGFLIHVAACTLYGFSMLDLPGMNGFIDSYLDALYTPFSIILAYEVYELIRAIPESFSVAIGKQFEVMSLLVVRDIFKNLADVEATRHGRRQRCRPHRTRSGGVSHPVHHGAVFPKHDAQPKTTG